MSEILDRSGGSSGSGEAANPALERLRGSQGNNGGSVCSIASTRVSLGTLTSDTVLDDSLSSLSDSDSDGGCTALFDVGFAVALAWLAIARQDSLGSAELFIATPFIPPRLPPVSLFAFFAILPPLRPQTTLRGVQPTLSRLRHW